MDEAAWLACTDPQRMLEFLRGRASDRKLRLFAVACCRRIWQMMGDGRSRQAVERVEEYVDGLIDRDTQWEAWQQAYAVRHALGAKATSAAHEAATAAIWVSGVISVQDEVERPNMAVRSALYAELPPPLPSGEESGGELQAWWHKAGTVCRAQCDFLRDLFGNPFCRTTVDPHWLKPGVAALARSIYDERQLPSGHLDPARLAILADALEEAGSTDDAILGHLRGPGPHVRGCWVLDLLTGKS